MQTVCTNHHPHSKKRTENRCKISFTPFSKEWLSYANFHENENSSMLSYASFHENENSSMTLNGDLILNFTKNGLEKHGKYKYKLIYALKLDKVKKPIHQI
jgi:hypothetical protein